MKTVNIYNTSIPSSIDSIGDATNEVIEYLRYNNCNLDENTLFDIKVILNELLINAVRHGNKEEPSKSVKLSVGVNVNNCLFVIVEDEGKGFNYKCLLENNVQKPDENDMCKMNETGRGIMIVNSLCDGIRFNAKGNKVIVIKSICRG